MKQICEAATDRKAEDIVIMEMKHRTAFCDYFILMSAPSTVRVKSIVEHIEQSMKAEGDPVRHKEGEKEAVWVLMDYAGVIVHVFHHETRKFYDLENLWGDAPKQPYVG